MTSKFLSLGLATTFLTATPISPQQLAPYPDEDWPTSDAASQGMDMTPIANIISRAQSGGFGNTDRIVVVKNGYLILDTAFSVNYRDVSRGHSMALGCGWQSCEHDSLVDPYNYLHPDFHPFWQGRSVHTLQSVTKSVAATVLGAAIHQRAITSLDSKLADYFGDYDLSGVDPRFSDITLSDLLTMRSGIEWHEADRPLDFTNTTLQLEHSEDWIQFTIDQPMDADPGTSWVYNSGGSHLMSGVVRAATGQFISNYAEDFLFGPLGIEGYHWKTTPRGYPDTEGGLFLEADDLARVALLYLRDGVWDGQRILPEGWAREATDVHAANINPQGWGYGYQWWRLDNGGNEIWAGLGFGGQFLLIFPEHDLIGIANSWNVFPGGSQTGILFPFMTALAASVNR